MPLLANAKKALRVSKRKTEINSRVKSILKTMVDKVKKSPGAQNLSDAYSAIDKAVKNNLLHKNKAARLKAQLSKLAKPVKVNGAVREGALGRKVVKPGKSEIKKAVAKKAAEKKSMAKKPAVKKTTKSVVKKSATKKTAKK